MNTTLLMFTAVLGGIFLDGFVQGEEEGVRSAWHCWALFWIFFLTCVVSYTGRIPSGHKNEDAWHVVIFEKENGIYKVRPGPYFVWLPMFYSGPKIEIVEIPRRNYVGASVLESHLEPTRKLFAHPFAHRRFEVYAYLEKRPGYQQFATLRQKGLTTEGDKDVLEEKFEKYIKNLLPEIQPEIQKLNMEVEQRLKGVARPKKSAHKSELRKYEKKYREWFRVLDYWCNQMVRILETELPKVIQERERDGTKDHLSSILYRRVELERLVVHEYFRF